MDTHNSQQRSTSVAVVEAIAARKGVDQHELPPLNDAVDPDALNDIVSDWVSRPSNRDEYVKFQYDDYTVVLYVDERLRIELE